jgi:triosephosphate isomerase (TIM)
MSETTAAKPRPEGPRRPLVSGNWKMHHDHIAALHVVRDLGFRLEGVGPEVEVSIHPPFTDLRTVQSVVEDRGLPLALGAQHCSEHDEGAFTGEVAPPMLARLGIRYVIVGHSERRQIFGMSDESVAATLKAVLRHSMVPILCVGETEGQRDAGEAHQVLERQLSTALRGVKPEIVSTIVIAYEPIWAIGTGRAATPEDAEEASRYIRERVTSLSGVEAGDGVRIQYGGSVTADNCGSLATLQGVDGLLVGGASLGGESFAAIIRAVAACYRSAGADRSK